MCRAAVDVYKRQVQGGASLENAEFTVKYYAGYYHAGNLPTNATRTWVIKTKKITSGDKTAYIAALDDSYKISGDELYKGSNEMCIRDRCIQDTHGHRISSALRFPLEYQMSPKILSVSSPGILSVP